MWNGYTDPDTGYDADDYPEEEPTNNIWNDVWAGLPPRGRFVWVNIRHGDLPGGVLRAYWSGGWRLTDHRPLKGTVTHWTWQEKPKAPTR